MKKIGFFLKKIEKNTDRHRQTDTDTNTDADRHGHGHGHGKFLKCDLMSFLLFDFTNLNFWRPCPRKSVGGGVEPPQTHSGTSHCASEMAPSPPPPPPPPLSPQRRIFEGRGARHSSSNNQLNRKWCSGTMRRARKRALVVHVAMLLRKLAQELKPDNSAAHLRIHLACVSQLHGGCDPCLVLPQRTE